MANQSKAPALGMHSRCNYGADHPLCLKVQNFQAIKTILNNTLTAQIIFVVAGEVDNAIALHLHHAGRQ